MQSQSVEAEGGWLKETDFELFSRYRIEKDFGNEGRGLMVWQVKKKTVIYHCRQGKKGKEIMRGMKIILAVLAVVTLVVPHYAAQVVAQTKESGEVERLIADLKDPSWQIRWYAAEVLGEAKDPRAVDPSLLPWGTRLRMSGRKQRWH